MFIINEIFRGTVCINSISLKLRKEFLEQLRSGEADDLVHYFLCLVKCAGQVIPTQVRFCYARRQTFYNVLNLCFVRYLGRIILPTS